MNTKRGEIMNNSKAIQPSVCLTSKTIHLPFCIQLTMGMSSRQARNGRWVPHRPCVCCAAEIGKESVAGFRIELALLETDLSWLLTECESLMERLADFGLKEPQIISAKELANDTMTFLQQHATGWGCDLTKLSPEYAARFGLNLINPPLAPMGLFKKPEGGTQ